MPEIALEGIRDSGMWYYIYMAVTGKKKKPSRKDTRDSISKNDLKATEPARRNFREYQKKWMKEQTLSIHLHFNVNNDIDVIEWMKMQDNKQDYIRQLIRADIARQERKKKREKAKAQGKK